jgi:hypothetical protein
MCSRSPEAMVRPVLTSHPRSLRPTRPLRAALLALAVGLALAALGGCASDAPPVCRADPSYGHPSVSVEVYRRAETERAARLAEEVARLRGDLAQAEEVLVMAESGLRGTHSRADAVSSLAEARIQLERAAKAAPWRSKDLDEAAAKLDEAAHQIDAGHFGAAFFFVYRASRIASEIEAEGKKVVARADTRFVRGQRINLRAGPSTRASVLTVLSAGTPVFPEKEERPWVLVRTTGGAVGWVHETLLGD